MEGSLVFVKTTADVELLKNRYGACCKLVFGDIGYAKNENGTNQNVMTAGSVFVFDEAKVVLLTTLKFDTFPVWLLVGGVFEDVWPVLTAELQRNVREARNGTGSHRATAIEVRSTDELLEVVRLGGEGAWENAVDARFPIWVPVNGTEQWTNVIGRVLLSSTYTSSPQWLIEDYRDQSGAGP